MKMMIISFVRRWYLHVKFLSHHSSGEIRKNHRNLVPNSRYSLQNITRVRWARLSAREGHMRNLYKLLVGKPDTKKSLGRPRRSWEDDIRMVLRKMW
jgi:hypothetical protein